jgi:hypothetical protein
MKIIYTLLIGILLAGSLFAQNTAEIRHASTPIVIDGVIESSWAAATPQAIETMFQSEQPTVTATWQALWDNEFFYVVVNVEDDDHFIGSPNYQFDKVELYFDVNEVLIDGKGPAAAATGHYQWAPGFKEAGYGAGEQIQLWDTRTPGGTYAYALTDNSYVYEFAAAWNTFYDLENNAVTSDVFRSRYMGFDVYIIDQDEGITTSRQRMTWNQDGKTNVLDESWNNMDEAGSICLGPCVDVDYWGPYIYLSSYSKILSSDGGSCDSISVLCDWTWTAVSNQEWLIISPKSLPGNGTLTFTASANTGATRTAKVSFSTIGNREPVLLVTQQAVGVGIISPIKNSPKITPNPATDRVAINGNADRVELFNSLGQKVKETSIKGRTFSVVDLQKGVYIVKAFSDNNMVGESKLVKN